MDAGDKRSNALSSAGGLPGGRSPCRRGAAAFSSLVRVKIHSTDNCSITIGPNEI